MAVSRLIADRLGNPSGIVGRLAASIWNRRNAPLNDTVLEALSLQPTDRVLEIGFGGGYLLECMARIVTDGKLAGVDISPAMVANAEKRFRGEIRAGRLDLRCAPAEALPFPPENFTKVCSTNSIFYWQDVGQGLREMLRVLGRGGRAVLCFTGKESLEKKSFARYLQLFETGEIEQMLAECGFRDIHTSPFSDKYRQYHCMTAQKDV